MSLSGNSTSSFATSNSLNETFSNTSAGSSRMSQKEIAILMPIYSISLLAALIGNFLIIVVFYMYKPIQKNINYFVVNMAISDLFTPLTIMPFKIAESLSNGTFLSQLPSSLSEVLCKLCFFLADTSILVSIISLMLISVDRLIAVVFPLQIKLISRKVRFICILMSWVVAISVHTPYLAVFAFKGGCFKEWDIETNNRYIVATFSTFFLIPVCLLIIIYGTITVSLKRGQLERMKMSKRKRSRDHKSNRRIIGVSVAILAAFAISIGPLFALNFIKIFHGQVPPEAKTYPAIEFIIGSLLVHSWGAINPIMCFAFSENYRAGLKHIVCGRSRAGSISSSATKKLTSSAKRTRNSSSNHFSITGIGGSEKEWLKLAGRIRIVATDKTKVTTSTEEHKF